ncbi:hypothetical protein V6N12_036070 [Hibiscus sabdariffa]|uniref:Uncharacterized protein n=1 Tax=Hibiscus sabdariffa TaxID=183260 RepID=A0ABR2EPJ8_9ROSI
MLSLSTTTAAVIASGSIPVSQSRQSPRLLLLFHFLGQVSTTQRHKCPQLGAGDVMKVLIEGELDVARWEVVMRVKLKGDDEETGQWRGGKNGLEAT